jgi:hypothetical protein
LTHIISGAVNSLSARIWLVGCFALLLSACSLIRDQADPTLVSIRGVPPTLEQLNVDATVYSQNQLVNDLMVAAGLPPGTLLKPYDDYWSLIMRAGVYEIGRQCDQYLDVLFRFNREQRAGRQDLAAAAAATGAIMGLSGVSAKAIAITAAAFGLATSLFDASVNSVLFTIEPSALRNVALQGRKKYLEDLRDRKVQINTRPDMLIALQGYLTQCSPAAIEANINNAANGSPFAVTSPEEKQAKDAAVLAAPGTALLPQVKQQVISEPTDILPPAPKPPRRPDTTTPLEQVNQQLIRQIQDTLCVTPANGDIGGLPGSSAPTRMAIRNFFSGRNRGSTAPEKFAALRADELKPSRYRDDILEAIAKARNKDGSVLNCSDPSRGFMSAFEVGLYGNLKPDEKASEIRLLQEAMRKVLGDDAGVPDNGMLDKPTREMIDRVRDKLQIKGPRSQVDYDLYNALGNP